MLNAHDGGIQTHDGLKLPLTGRVQGEIGSAAVQSNAGPHPIGANVLRFGMPQHGGTVAEASLA